MTKMKVLSLSLIIAMILTGSAYASWTQTINLQTTVETGILSVDVSASSSAGVSDEWSDDSLVFNPTSIAKVSGNNVLFEGSNFFPGAEQVSEILLINSGTIPVDIDISNIAEDMPTYMAYEIDIVTTDEVKSIDGASIHVLAGNFETLDVGESMHVTIKAKFSGNNKEEDMNENANYFYSFVFDVSQFNYDN
jgi:hypothetical protein